MHSAGTTESHPRTENFGYVCHRCLKCCHHKRIQLNPYEVARLARNRGLSTSEFRKAWTVDGDGVVLQQTATGACVFLGRDGCTVHADRPLVCRLYPLGRQLREDGTETFLRVETHPQSRGEFTGRGTIADFLAAQDAEPFIRAADDYFSWLCAIHETLEEASDEGSISPPTEERDFARDLLDMDSAIARHCAANSITAPADLEARRKLHLKILYQELEAIRGAEHAQT